MSEDVPEYVAKAQRAAEVKETLTKELAACYARVLLGSEDGRRVLADLRNKFPLNRVVFSPRDRGRYALTAAALNDGQRRVMIEIETALEMGAPGLAAKTAATA